MTAIACPRAGQIPSFSREIGRPSAAESMWESSGTRRPGDGVSTSTHRARFAAQSGGDPEEYGVDGSGYQDHDIRGKSTPREKDSPSRFKRTRPTRCRRTDARKIMEFRIVMHC
jgi:hypothetical protein